MMTTRFAARQRASFDHLDMRCSNLDPEAFLQSDRLHDADCLISDVQMPSVNGIELQSKLTVQGYQLPIIFVTAFSEMRARAQALSAGAIVFLAKPFSDEELIARLDKALAARGM
jgi:FixJ family two-component response regulator